MDNNQRVFRLIHIALVSCALLFLISVVTSCWWLRPINWDGSRFTLYLIQYQKPHIDLYRFLNGIFQIPTVIWMKLVPSASPLVLARIYFLTLTLPIYSYFTFRIFKAKDYAELMIPSAILFLAYVPAFSFTVNTVSETMFFFYLMANNRNVNRTRYFIFGLLAALGHPAVLLGFIIIFVLDILENKILRFESVFLLFLSAISAYFIYYTNVHHPSVLTHFPNVIIAYLSNLTNFAWNFHTIAVLFIFLVFALSFLPVKQRNIVQYVCLALTLALIATIPYFRIMHLMSHNYRIFTVAVIMALVIYKWISDRYTIKAGIIPVGMLLLIAIYGVQADLRISLDYKNVFDELKSLEMSNGCHVVDVTDSTRTYANMSFPIYKLLVDSKTDVSSIYYEKEFMKGADPCKAQARQDLQGAAIQVDVVKYPPLMFGEGTFKFRF